MYLVISTLLMCSIIIISTLIMCSIISAIILVLKQLGIKPTATTRTARNAVTVTTSARLNDGAEESIALQLPVEEEPSCATAASRSICKFYMHAFIATDEYCFCMPAIAKLYCHTIVTINDTSYVRNCFV